MAAQNKHISRSIDLLACISVSSNALHQSAISFCVVITRSVAKRHRLELSKGFICKLLIHYSKGLKWVKVITVIMPCLWSMWSKGEQTLNLLHDNNSSNFLTTWANTARNVLQEGKGQSANKAMGNSWRCRGPKYWEPVILKKVVYWCDRSTGVTDLLVWHFSHC